VKELVVISGKGGTGKTSLMAAFASLTKNKVLCDADVDAADLHLLANPKIKERHDFQGGGIAVINPDKCTQCELCRELCRWEAISEQFEVDSIECEGCGVCVDFCPEQAIDFPLQTCGQWFISDTRFGPMVHARLGIAEENSGKLVTLVRQEAKKLAEKHNLNLLITDGPPGIGCPVIASITGATLLAVVTEPTISGKHDMKRVLELAKHFSVPALVIVNKWDLNPEMTIEIEEETVLNGAHPIGRIPYDRAFTVAQINGRTLVEETTGEVVENITTIWEKVCRKLK